MQFCELVKCGGKVVIGIISNCLEINQAKLGGDFCKKKKNMLCKKEYLLPKKNILHYLFH